MENDTPRPVYRPPAEFSDALLALIEEFRQASKRPVKITIVLEDAA